MPLKIDVGCNSGFVGVDYTGSYLLVPSSDLLVVVLNSRIDDSLVFHCPNFDFELPFLDAWPSFDFVLVACFHSSFDFVLVACSYSSFDCVLVACLYSSFDTVLVSCLSSSFE